MLNIELDGSEPEHVERIEPQMSTDAQGNISWVPSLLDHNAKVFHRGKTVTNEEFNELFLHQVYRGNYLTDSLSKLFGSHLSNAIRGKFRSDFKLVPSYIKTFTSADWGALQEDGYYYINIPAEEHGFTIDPEEAALDRINIGIEMYLLSPEGLFYEVTQAHINTDNTVQIYTDDNTIPGFIVIRANEKSYALVDVTISANQVNGLHAVATSGKYADLIDINAANGPNTKIKQNTTAIQAILDGYKIVDDIQEEVRVALADKANEAADADNLTGSINNIDIKDIFEDDATSYIVKEATNASKINNLVITEDDIGILKNGDKIIPQERVIAVLNKEIGEYAEKEQITLYTVLKDLTGLENKLLKVQFRIGNNAVSYHEVVFPVTITDYIEQFIYCIGTSYSYAKANKLSIYNLFVRFQEVNNAEYSGVCMLFMGLEEKEIDLETNTIKTYQTPFTIYKILEVIQ